MAVFVSTFLFCLVTQTLGPTSRALLVADFMRLARLRGGSRFIAFIFTTLMFVTFDIAFVIMPKGPLEAAFASDACSRNRIVRGGSLRVAMARLRRAAGSGRSERRGDPAAYLRDGSNICHGEAVEHL